MGEIHSTNSLIAKRLFIAILFFLAAAFLFDGQTMVLPHLAFGEDSSTPSELFDKQIGQSCDLLRSTDSNSLEKRPSQSNGKTKESGNPYLALVQRAINEKWTAPPVDISGQVLTTVIRFRLQRNGIISNVTIERSSGNDWYDLSARRAVLSVDRLPPFPPDIDQSYFEISFTFAVGDVVSPQKIVTDEDRLIVEKERLSRRHQIDRCREHLKNLSDAVLQVRETQEAVETLRRLADELSLAEDSSIRSSDTDDIRYLAQEVRRSAINREKEITENLAATAKLQQFDTACERIIRKAGFPPHLRDEPVDSSLQVTNTLGRAFCTAVNGGGTVEFRVIDETPPPSEFSSQQRNGVLS
ncbi:energy transducer TonB [Nitrospira sp. Nam80]